MHWYATFDMTGSLTDDQVDLLANDRPSTFHVNGPTNTVAIVIDLDADSYDKATRQALTRLGRLTGVQQLISEQVLTPHRLMIQDADTADADAPILSTAEAARRLGVAPARVRQLRQQVLGFPRTVPMPGAAGDFYWAADIDRFVVEREVGTHAAGRPRATDDPELRATIRVILQHGTLDKTIRSQMEAAVEAEGGRFVRGKALLLARLPKERLEEVANALEAGPRDLFFSIIARAREIAG